MKEKRHQKAKKAENEHFLSKIYTQTGGTDVFCDLLSLRGLDECAGCSTYFIQGVFFNKSALDEFGLFFVESDSQG